MSNVEWISSDIEPPKSQGLLLHVEECRGARVGYWTGSDWILLDGSSDKVLHWAELPRVPIVSHLPPQPKSNPCTIPNFVLLRIDCRPEWDGNGRVFEVERETHRDLASANRSSNNWCGYIRNGASAIVDASLPGSTAIDICKVGTVPIDIDRRIDIEAQRIRRELYPDARQEVTR